MIKFENVSYGYGNGAGRQVLQNLSLTIAPGEEVAVMGANGCGKTTLGMMLCGIIRPQAGRILINDSELAAGEITPGVGFLFQDPDNGLVATTVEREAAFGLENRNESPDNIQRRVDELLEMFKLSVMRHQLVWNLSGGEKQRLALAGIFAVETAILFLDEPASYLDFAGERVLEETLSKVREKNPELTIIRVTQYPTIADRYPRLLIMKDGTISCDGRPRDVFKQVEKIYQAGIRPPLKYLPLLDEAKTNSSTPRLSGPLLTVKNLGFSYNPPAPALLHGLNLKILRGEVLALVGKSGSGKSTLAQILCGIYDAHAGTASFSDESGRAVMSFQQPERQFYMDTCLDEVTLSLKNAIADRDKLESRTAEIFAMAGLDYMEFKDRDPHTLSGGEARRLAFAVIIGLDADLLIFDEPTCGLDESGVAAFKKMVQSLISQNKSVLLITHNSEIIGDLADRIMLLENGAIKIDCTPLEFFNRNHHDGLLQSPEVITYQQEAYGEVMTARSHHLFGLFQINP